MSSATLLSHNDKNVLSALFDAECLPSKSLCVSEDSESLPGVSALTLMDLQSKEAEAIRPLNSPDPTKEQIQLSIERISALVAQNRMYASAWNNRAQATRMLVGDDITEPIVAISSLYSDLNEAIRLSSPANDGTHATNLQCKTLASAYTHRGHLLYKASKSLSRDPTLSSNLPRELQGSDGGTLEKMAGADFKLGGRYGNEIAKQMAIQLNPYAKLCGEIVREAMINDMKESGVIPASYNG